MDEKLKPEIEPEPSAEPDEDEDPADGAAVARFLDDIARAAGVARPHPRRPGLAVYESPETMVFCVDAPGVTPDDVRLELTHRNGRPCLTVAVERKPADVRGKCIESSVRLGKWDGALLLPVDFDGTRMPETSLRNGVLKVTVYRSKPQAIPVKGD